MACRKLTLTLTLNPNPNTTIMPSLTLTLRRATTRRLSHWFGWAMHRINVGNTNMRPGYAAAFYSACSLETFKCLDVTVHSTGQRYDTKIFYSHTTQYNIQRVNCITRAQGDTLTVITHSAYLSSEAFSVTRPTRYH